MAKERLITIRLDDEEHERFEKVASAYGIDVSATIRFLMKREEDALMDQRKLPRKRATT